MIRSDLIALLTTFALTACAVGPNYKPPETGSNAATTFIGSAAPAVTVNASDDHWWRLYQDPVLDRLVADALAANTDLRVAVANLERANALLREARSARLPQTDVGASTSYQRVPDTQRLPGEKRELGLLDAGLNVSYEADLFGRVRRGVEAAKADRDAAAADADAARVAIVAQTVRAYTDAASAAEQLAVAIQIVDILDNSLRVTEGRAKAGLATHLDVVRIATLRDQRRAFVPPLMAQRQSALFRLALLTGRTPKDLPEEVMARATTPRIEQPIPVGDGRALLARRPDVRAAERRLAADTARVGVATADLYPRISFGGGIGTSSRLSDMFDGGALRWLVGPSISWSFPNQEAVRARIGASRADASASLARFDGAVLEALRETETAISSYANELDRYAQLSSARDLADSAARISRAQRREGQLDFLDLLDAERTAAETEADLAASKGRIASAQVDLFRALGGSWQ